MIKVSIIVPIYNVEKQLAKCLDSLLNQTLKDIQIILVNDGSEDSSAEIAKKYVVKDPDRVLYFEKENGGLSDARNYGLKYATGEYISFVDSDDYITENLYTDLLPYMEQKYDMIKFKIAKVDEQGNVIAATYITQGQNAFIYNDITKYFKYGDKYDEYVKGLYPSELEYKRDMLETYQIKIEAYKYAKEKVLREFPQYGGDIMAFLEHELQEPNNGFHEKSKLREKLNSCMSEYIQKMESAKPGVSEMYQRFYWFTADKISKEFGKENVKPNSIDAKELETFLSEEEREYQKILESGPLVIHERPNFDIEKYYTSTSSNAIELDTYITDPRDRKSGLARILLLEGIDKHMKEFFVKPENQEIFLCSTLHRDNLSSKYVSEFFGLTDSLYVKRRDGINREVHICKIGRDEYENYLNHMRKRVAVLYGYNPNGISISREDRLNVLMEQLQYEEGEINRLQSVAPNNQRYNGHIDFAQRKIDKVASLKKKVEELQETKKEEGER